MSIVYNGSIDTKPSAIQSGTYDPTTDSLIVVESTTPSWRRYNYVTFQELASATCVAGPSSVTLINTLSSVIGSSSNGTMDIIENATGYRTNISGGIAQTVARDQKSAGDPTNGVVMLVNAGKTLTKVTSGQVVTQITPSSPSFFSYNNEQLNCIILMSPGNFLVGGKFGKVYQIDDSGNILGSLTVTLPNTGQLVSAAAGNLSVGGIYSLSYDNNILLVSSDNGGLSLWDWTTKTNLAMWGNQGPSVTFASTLCDASSGEVISSYFNTTSPDNTIRETDFTVQPIYTRDNLFTGVTNPIVCTGFAANSVGFALQQTAEKIRLFSVTPRATTTRTVTLPAGYTQARLIWLDDTNGIGTIQVLLDTIMVSPGTYRIPTGRSIIEIVKCGYGTSASWGASRYST